MSISFSCKCEERKKPIKERKWVVVERNCNHSAFNGYQRQYSAYSSVYCKKCKAIGRTRAGYVNELSDGRIE